MAQQPLVLPEQLQPAHHQEAAPQLSDPSRIRPQLLPELAERIVSYLPPNEVACTVRLINKAAAAQFSGPRYTTVRLSLSSPIDAFRQRWGSPGAMRGLTLKQREQLVCLTARSGSIPNLEVAAANVGWLLDGSVMEAAASAGQLDACRWLRERDCPLRHALSRAALTGHQAVCEWLLARGCGYWDHMTVPCAAFGGHSDLMDWLLQQYPMGDVPPNPLLQLEGAARGCDLPTLQRLTHKWLGVQQLGEEWEKMVLKFAVRSPTPDWRAKVEWLEALGCPKSADACAAAVTRPEAVGRLAWLRQRGYPVDGSVASAATSAGAVDLLQSLLAEGVRPKARDLERAAFHGHLAILAILHSYGCSLNNEVMKSAARGGHLALVTWLAETLGEAELLRGGVFAEAARSGNMALLSWLRERGCPWDEDTFIAAASAGNEVALEWLVEQGCPMPVDGKLYTVAARSGDLATLRCLRRLGCPWGAHGEVFTEWIQSCGSQLLYACEPQNPLPALQCMLEEGCPVDWAQAVWAAEEWNFEKVISWLQQQRVVAEGGAGGVQEQ